MKIAVVGCGSMGRRRIRHVQQLGLGELFTYDRRQDRRDEVQREFGVHTVDSAPEDPPSGAIKLTRAFGISRMDKRSVSVVKERERQDIGILAVTSSPQEWAATIETVGSMRNVRVGLGFHPPDFRVGRKKRCKFLCNREDVADLGVPRARWGYVRPKKTQQIRLG